jgi:NADH-quinone oxidoreductase subunit L
MKLPLIILAVLTVIAGFVPFGDFVTPTGKPAHGGLHLLFSVGPVLIALTGISLAWMLYYRESEKPAKIATAMGGFYRTAKSKFYVDEAYLFVTQKVLFNMVGKPAAWVDKNIVDGSMNFTGFLTLLFSELTRGIQSGKVQQYAIYFLGGIISIAVYLIYYHS